MKDSKKQSKSSNNLPNDPCELCLVVACCQDPCTLLEDYIGTVFDLAESDLEHPILDRFPPAQKDSITSYVKAARKLVDRLKERNKL